MCILKTGSFPKDSDRKGTDPCLNPTFPDGSLHRTFGPRILQCGIQRHDVTVKDSKRLRHQRLGLLQFRTSPASLFFVGLRSLRGRMRWLSPIFVAKTRHDVGSVLPDSP